MSKPNALTSHASLPAQPVVSQTPQLNAQLSAQPAAPSMAQASASPIQQVAHVGLPQHAPRLMAHGAAPAHDGAPCTAGCCNTCAPCYPTLPSMAALGINPNEYLCDGGDQAPRSYVRNDDSFAGLGLEDTVVKYETGDGRIHVTESNRVCVYAPRFASVRRVTGANIDAAVHGPIGIDRPFGPADVLAPQPSNAVMNPVEPISRELAKGPDALRARDLGVPVDNVQRLEMEAQKQAALANIAIVSDGVLRDADRPWLAKGNVAAQAWSLNDTPRVVVDSIQARVAARDQAAEAVTTYDLPNGKLRVIKLADRQTAQVGDEVTFVLRVENTGIGPINNVVLSDNLTTRLEYVADSQTCSKGAVFTTQENEGGSLQLNWQFTDKFGVGEAAVIRFRCRVR